MVPLSRIYTTCSSQELALQLLTPLVEQELVACVNLCPILSVYKWQGAIEKAEEVACFLKLLPKNVPQVVSWLEARHPYEVPLIITTEVLVNEAYDQWVRGS